MSFLTPLAFLLAILLPVIIAMYLLKLRRTEQLVSSTYLWQRMVRDVEANAPWQRLRRNLLLLLQLLFLITLILVLVRPFTWAQGSAGQAVIMIFDTSASMAATDLSPNRLDAAKNQARLLVSNLPVEARGTIITAGENTRVLVSSSQDKRQLYQGIDQVQVQPSGSDLTSALELASAIASRQPDAEIVIYSDGQANFPERLSTQGHVRYLKIGESGDNQAVSLITLEPDTNTDLLTAFVQVTNYHEEPVQRRLTLSADGRLVDAYDLEIPARGQVSILSEIIPADTETLEAALTEFDALPLDDRAWAIQQVSGDQDITLVSKGNRFLETALGLLPGIDTQIFPDWQSANPQADLIIFDNLSPDSSDQEFSNLFYVGPISSTHIYSITGLIKNPIPQPVADNDPLLEYVDLSGVSILDSARIPLPDWARPVLVDENSGAPLLFVGEIEGRRVAVLTFDPKHSDLPLQVGYPIMIANLVNWLVPGRIGEIPNQVTSGQVLTFTPPPEIEVLTVTRPDGSGTRLEIQNGRALYADTTQPGVYRVSWGEDQSLVFAVNLSSPQESDILPAESLPLFGDPSESEDTFPQQARREWWRPLTFIALIILVIEWLVYNRATLSKLRYQIIGNGKSKTESISKSEDHFRN